jgi:hypothetical protein
MRMQLREQRAAAARSELPREDDAAGGKTFFYCGFDVSNFAAGRGGVSAGASGSEPEPSPAG